MANRDADDPFHASPRRQRPVPEATPAHLREVALRYVERFWGPSANLRRVLQRHLDRSVRCHATDRAAGLNAIDAIVREFCEALLVNDAQFAHAAARNLHGRGKSRALIGQQLRARGLSDGDVAAALAGMQDDELTDRTAAFALAKRRRIGPYRTADRAQFRQKDMAVLARGGFGFGLAREVIDWRGEVP